MCIRHPGHHLLSLFRRPELGNPDLDPWSHHHVLRGSPCRLLRGLKKDPGLLLHVPDRIHPSRDRHALPPGGTRKPGSRGNLPPHDEPLPHQAGALHGRWRGLQRLQVSSK